MYEQTYQKEGSIPQTYLMETYPNGGDLASEARCLILILDTLRFVKKLDGSRLNGEDKL